MRVVVTGGTAGPVSGSYANWRRRGTRWSTSMLRSTGAGAPRRVLPGRPGRRGQGLRRVVPVPARGHLPSRREPAPSGQAQIDVFDNNVVSAHNLMQAAGDLGVSRVVYASSEMATGLLTEGTVPAQIPFDESERHPSRMRTHSASTSAR